MARWCEWLDLTERLRAELVDLTDQSSEYAVALHAELAADDALISRIESSTLGCRQLCFGCDGRSGTNLAAFVPGLRKGAQPCVIQGRRR